MIRFVTGTDTGVGKTVAAAVLAHIARSRGLRVRYLKPVQTGVAPGALGDADFVRSAAGVDADELERFTEPLAPAVAAERAGRVLEVAGLAAAILRVAATADETFVEGAGGLLAPLSGERTMADLACDLDAELVVVTRPGLGTLNHTALTLDAARHRGLRLAGLVVCGWPRTPSLAEETNLVRLRSMAPLIAVVRRIRGLSVDDGRAEPLQRALERGTAFAPVP
jgi:dethiobiotin synthetase